ncbi:MAG: glycosyltransferase, partial [Actinomycetota bacterium]
MKRLISVIVPAYNEESCIEELVRRLSIVFTKNSGYDFETIFIENGSTDRTWEILQKVHQQDARFKVVRL